MRTLTLPETQLTVSVLGLGTGGLGTQVSRDDSFRLLDLFLELGGNLLDSAHIYAAWVPGGQGASEQTVGAWMRARGARERVVIGTKGGHPHLHSMDVARLSPAEIVRDLEESLDRLQVDAIDLYWLHRDDPGRPTGEMVETLASCVTAGKIRHWGVSNWTVSRIQDARQYAVTHGLPGPVASQIGWSLADRRPDAGGDPTMLFMDRPTMDFHRETHFPVVAYSSQANGFFADASRRSPDSGYFTRANLCRLERATALAERLARQPNDIALAYVTSQPFPACALIGCSSPEHLRSSCAAGDLALSPNEVEWLTPEES